MRTILYERRDDIASVDIFESGNVHFHMKNGDILSTGGFTREVIITDGYYEVYTQLHPDGEALYFDSGSIKKIYVDKEKKWPYHYCIKVIGACPKSADHVSFQFYDKTNDEYNLAIYSRTEDIHTVRFNSDNPSIKKIEFKFY